MKSTRQRLLDMLENRPGATAADLSRALQVTQADIRHHLTNMVQEGLIVTTGQQRSGRRGRPARRFSLAASVYKDNFDLLSKALLITSLESLRPEEQTSFLSQVANHLVAGASLKGPLSQRLVQVVNHLNAMGYQSRWEAHAEAPRIIFERCPFAALRPLHPELCQLDAVQLETLTGASIILLESNAHLADGYCMFLVGKISTGSDTT